MLKSCTDQFLVGGDVERQVGAQVLYLVRDTVVEQDHLQAEKGQSLKVNKKALILKSSTMLIDSMKTNEIVFHFSTRKFILSLY